MGLRGEEERKGEEKWRKEKMEEDELLRVILLPLHVMW